MRFNIYGRYDLEVARVDEAWVVHRVDGHGPAARRRRADLVVPSHLNETEVATYLDDLLHEQARPGDEIRRVDPADGHPEDGHPGDGIEMADWALRRAVAGDADGLAACMDAAYGPFKARISDLPDVSADVAGEIARLPVWVAEAGDAIIGGLVLDPQDGFMLLANVAVHPASQGVGLGRGLMALAEREAVAQGYVEMRLTTHVRMPENVALYVRLGWQETGRHGNKVGMHKVL